MNTWDWSGARWWKFDFHTHTPASLDYGKGPDQAVMRNRQPREWILDYMLAEIDCLAVTDHNSGAWLDQLKAALSDLERERPPGFRPLWLFPGVEISVNGGLHVLAIFGPGAGTSDIDSLLGAIRFDVSRKGSCDAETQSSFSDVVHAVAQANALAIPAHVDLDKGLFRLTGTTLRQTLDCEQVFAMEMVNPESRRPQLFVDKKTNWTEILGSDAHHPTGDDRHRFPGSHFTWIKMGTPSLEGLRLALLDGPLSVCRSDQRVDDPNHHAALVIEAIGADKSRYLGRAATFDLRMNPWLNAIIGGRGTGKSTLVEFLRLALRRQQEIPARLEGDFEKYGKVYLNRNEDGLLTEDSHFTVVYRKDRTRFRIQWNQRGDTEPIEVEDGSGGWKPDQGDIQQRFPVRIYSQKQIFELAKDPLALLRIVDEAPAVDRRTWYERWKEAETRFLTLRAKAREMETGLAEEPRLRGELEDCKRRLAIFEEAGHADTLKHYQQRLRQQREVERWERNWSEAGERLREVAGGLVPDPLDPSHFDQAHDEDLDLLAKASIPLKVLETACQGLKDLAAKLDEAMGQWKQVRDGSHWKQAVEEALENYQKLCEKLKAEEAGDPSVYGELVQRRQAIEGKLKDFGSRRGQIEALRKDAEASLRELQELRRELTRRRADFLREVLVNNPYVRIDVVAYGSRETVESEFRGLIQREAGGFEKDIGTVDGDGLLGSLYSGAASATDIEARLAIFKKKLKEIAAGTLQSNPLRDQRFAAYLAKLPPEVFDRLDLWFVEDSLQVHYSNPGRGSEFRSIQEGSPGQKTAALLAFLFSYGEEPIILDQPEDDLDNHLIYELIVAQLRGIKKKRQVIVVTHNANIVVNGDAEFVVALVARAGETQQECAGSLQERSVRDTICAVMEGGREAFEQRYRRIALEGRHV